MRMASHTINIFEEVDTLSSNQIPLISRALFIPNNSVCSETLCSWRRGRLVTTCVAHRVRRVKVDTHVSAPAAYADLETADTVCPLRMRFLFS